MEAKLSLRRKGKIMHPHFLLFTFLCLLFSLPVSANDIDDLKTATDVNGFLKKISPKDTEPLLLDTKETSNSEYGKNTFHKLDIDGNGKTDLIIESEYLFAVTDNHEIETIDRGGFTFYRYTLFNIEKVGNDTLLHIRPRIVPDFPRPPSDKELTLVFKFGGFIEYNPKPDDLKIDSVDLSTSGCFGSCPIFTISIKANRTAAYLAKQYNPKNGTFSGTVEAADYSRIVDTINYMRLGSLKTGYAVGWTDDQGSTLTIGYNSGKVKKISDYGMIGTYGLANLYRQFFKLRTSQNWKRVK